MATKTTSRTRDELEQEVADLREQVQGLAEKTAPTTEELHERLINQPLPDYVTASPMMHAARTAIESERRQMRAWLAAFGIDDESDEDLRSFLWSCREFDEYARRNFVGLVSSIAGEPIESCDLQQVVSCWPQLSSAVRKAVARLADYYASQSPNYS